MTERPRVPKHDNSAEIAELRGRALLMLDAFQAEQPTPVFTQLRDVVENARRLSDLRSIVRDLRGGMAGLSLRGRASLERALRQRFGPDANWERERELVAKIRLRGRI